MKQIDRDTDIDYNFTEDRPQKIVDINLMITLLGGILLIGGLVLCSVFILFFIIGLKNGFVMMWIVSGIAEVVGIILCILGFKLL